MDLEKSKGKVKRTPNAYLLYGNAIRPSLKISYPHATTTDIGVILGEKWRMLPEAEKREFRKKAIELKNERAMAKLNLDNEDRHVNESENDVPSQHNESVTLKRPPNAFILFNVENRSIVQKEHAMLSGPELSRLMGTKWRSLPTNKKKLYADRALAARQVFYQKNPNFVYRNPSLPYRPYTRAKKDAHAPIHPLSAYLFYQSHHRLDVTNNFPHFTNGETSRYLAKQWQQASEEEKELYYRKAAQDKQRYAAEKTLYKKLQAHNLPLLLSFRKK